jgi:hypothetical protein
VIRQGSTLALRSQLPRANRYYAERPADVTVESETVSSSVTDRKGTVSDPYVWGVQLCCVCGGRSDSVCASCKQTR